MRIWRELGLLATALLLQSVCYCSGVLEEQAGAPAVDGGEESFLDTLMRPGTDMLATFGLEVLENLTQQNAECRMNMSRTEMKYTKVMGHLVDYHRSMEKLVSIPTFAEFSNEDRPAVEANFHQTLKHMEASRNKELRKVHQVCNSTQQEWLAGTLLRAVSHAKKVLAADRRQYMQLREEMVSYRASMQRHLSNCRHSRHSFELMYCHVEELETLTDLIDSFLDTMHGILLMQYGDDEDLTSGDQGSGVEEVIDTDEDFDATRDPNPTTASEILTRKVSTIKLPPEFFGPRPKIIYPPRDSSLPEAPVTGTPNGPPLTSGIPSPTTSSSEAPGSTGSAPTEAATMPTSQLSASTSRAEVSVAGSPSQFSSGEDSSEIPEETSPSPASEAPWLDSAFKEVLSLRDHTSSSESDPPPTKSSPPLARGDLRQSSKKVSKSRRPPGSKTLPHPPSVDLEFQGSKVDVSIELGAGDLEEDQTHSNGRLQQENQPHSQSDTSGWTYTSSILTFFFLTLGVVVAVFSAIIITMVTINRYNKRRRRQKVEPPVLTENDMLAVMKKTGYVNPTYKFFTQSS